VFVLSVLTKNPSSAHTKVLCTSLTATDHGCSQEGTWAHGPQNISFP